MNTKERLDNIETEMNLLLNSADSTLKLFEQFLYDHTGDDFGGIEDLNTCTGTLETMKLIVKEMNQVVLPK